MNVGLLFKVKFAMVFWWLFVLFDVNFWECYAVMSVVLSLFLYSSDLRVTGGLEKVSIMPQQLWTLSTNN